MFRKIKSREYPIVVADFVKHILPNQKADKAFQANEFTRWDPANASGYMTATIRGMAPSKFIFADVEMCLQAAIDNERPEDMEYFQKHYDAGTKFLNLDSNNRCINIGHFLNNKISIPSNDYFIDGDIHKVSKDKNDVYSKLPKRLRLAFDEGLIAVHIYEDATREELSDIFTNVNEGKPLNPAEKRNASTSKIAEDIRDLTVSVAPILNHENAKWFDKTAVNRRGMDDFVAGMFFYFCFGMSSQIGPATLSQLYTIGSTEEKYHLPLFKKRFKSFMKYFEGEHINVLVNRNSIFDLWIIYLQLKKDDKKELNQKKLKSFIKHYAIVVGNLLGDKTLHERLPIKDDASFETMIGGKQIGNLLKRNQLIMKELDVDKFFISIDSKRVITDTEKMVVGARDEFKTLEGEDIELAKYNDGKSYHKGHKEPHADGNPSTVDNTGMQTAEINLKLGRNPVKV